MPRRILSQSDKAAICEAMAGLSGANATHEAAQLAEFYGITPHRIYAVSRRSRPGRKQRADHGRRAQDILNNDALRFAAELVANQKLAPELALETMRANSARFGRADITLGTFRRYLREHGVSRTQAKRSAVAFRSFEADFPGQVYQFDISGVKERWVDVKTRSIHKVSVLEVSRNHANRRQDRVPLWKFTLVDDYSRLKLVRFVACPKPNTIHVVNFLREAFETLGVPFYLYTDNDAIIINKRMTRGARFLNEAFAASGGFEMIQHLPGNPRATGKVERAHQVVEEFEKLIGVKAEYGAAPTVEALNLFAERLCEFHNNRPHRATGTAPHNRFRETTNPKRLVRPEQFDAAFKARDLLLKINPDITITVDGRKYQLSRRDEDPFLVLAETKQKIEVYWLDDEEFFALVTPAGDEYVVEKIEARADRLGEYKQLPETRGQQVRKDLRESQKKRIKSLKSEAGGDALIVPGIDAPIAAEAAETDRRIVEFPRRVEEADAAALDDLTHGVAAEAGRGRDLDLFDALALIQNEFSVPTLPCPELVAAKDRLRQVFGDRETIAETEIRQAWTVTEVADNVRRLRAV